FRAGFRPSSSSLSSAERSPKAEKCRSRNPVQRQEFIHRSPIDKCQYVQAVTIRVADGSPAVCTRICLPLPSIGHERLIVNPAILEAVMRLQFQPMPLLKRAAPFD